MLVCRNIDDVVDRTLVDMLRTKIILAGKEHRVL